MAPAAKFSWPEGGGTHSLTLPQALGTLGYSIKPSTIPDTPPWEWFISNIPVDIFPGLVNGFTGTREAAKQAVCAALAFWRARGYVTVDIPMAAK